MQPPALAVTSAEVLGWSCGGGGFPLSKQSCGTLNCFPRVVDLHRRTELPWPTLDTFGEGELADLDDRTVHILRMRAGMVDGQRHRLAEIGDELDLGVNRVRQLQNEGLVMICQVREVQRHMADEPKGRRYRWRKPR